mmetsp:Transcript_11183/g.30941  ORF Transcript_11183/g.30941 Transcript_11183/m.30941 type:complete len:125 (-) Transcript_11183:508-882(-)
MERGMSTHSVPYTDDTRRPADKQISGPHCIPCCVTVHNAASPIYYYLPREGTQLKQNPPIRRNPPSSAFITAVDASERYDGSSRPPSRNSRTPHALLRDAPNCTCALIAAVSHHDLYPCDATGW